MDNKTISVEEIAEKTLREIICCVLHNVIISLENLKDINEKDDIKDNLYATLGLIQSFEEWINIQCNSEEYSLYNLDDKPIEQLYRLVEKVAKSLKWIRKPSDKEDIIPQLKSLLNTRFEKETKATSEMIASEGS